LAQVHLTSIALFVRCGYQAVHGTEKEV